MKGSHKIFAPLSLKDDAITVMTDANLTVNIGENLHILNSFVLIRKALLISHDVKAAILVFQNNEKAVMLVYQTNPLVVELFSNVSTCFSSGVETHCT